MYLMLEKEAMLLVSLLLKALCSDRLQPWLFSSFSAHSNPTAPFHYSEEGACWTVLAKHLTSCLSISTG